MKKGLLAAVLIITFCLVGLNYVSAELQPDVGSGPAGCGGGCNGQQQTDLFTDEETIEKYSAFLKDTVDFRRELAAKQREIQALVATDNYDTGKAAMLTQEFYQLRDLLQNMAIDAGFANSTRGGGCGGGPLAKR